MKLLISINGRAGELDIQENRFRYASATGVVDAEASVVEVELGIFSILLEGRSYEAKITSGPNGFVYVDVGGRRWAVEVRDPRSFSRNKHAGIGHGRQTISAPMPGKVVRVLVHEGAVVEAGAGLVVVEAMKMQNELKAPKAGTVVRLSAKEGDTVAAGEPLVVIE
jgi:biotin carboxyl carrier protein